jgi:Plastocyanin
MQQHVQRRIKFAIILIGLGIILAGCQTGADKGADPHTNPGLPDKTAKTPTPQSSAEQPDANEVRIEIENFVFKPADITVAPGTKVTWINKDEAPHTATSTDQKFNSGGLDTDDKFSFVFNEKGDYPYFCTLHPHMKAQIKVR